MIRIVLFAFLLFTQTFWGQEQVSFYFESNQHQLKKNELARLTTWLEENKKVKIVAINGYTDVDGSVSFNDTLAQKRVHFVFEKVKDQVAIRSDCKTRSFGKLHQHQMDKAKNRRVTLFYLLEKDLSMEDELLDLLNTDKQPVVRPKKTYPDSIQITNPNGSVSTYALNREFMQQIDAALPGEKYKIDNLNFHLNTFAIVNESRGKLYELLLVLQQNPELEIKIQGHLCCMPKDPNQLSSQRAKAIHQFLTLNGIEKSRLTYQGYGSSQPIYPIPEKNEAERAANRRVEIEIIKN